MRRLAKTFRKDDYSSLKDYQDIIKIKTNTIKFINDSEKNTLFFSTNKTFHSSSILGIGGFIYADNDCILCITIYDKNIKLVSQNIKLKNLWNRIGFAFLLNNSSNNIHITLEFVQPLKSLSYYGLNLDNLVLDNFIDLSNTHLDTIPNILNVSHLIPETLYLDHDKDSYLILNDDKSSSFVVFPNSNELLAKKCCYCERVLPVDKTVNLSSSFHKHKSKKSGFQNECRSCKKWRINDYFNPDRTPDKLNESSIITRERKILLREPDQIIKLKDRNTGDGLKSQVWKRFNKKCFNCGEPLKLSEVQLDHTRPLAYLWPIDQFATCLCSICNNNKHDSFPIDFYTEEQLVKLSKIIHLDYDELVKKDVNEVELNRIIDNIEYFSQQLDERTFRSIAVKVKSLRPNTDLFEILRNKNRSLYNDLINRLSIRKE